MISVDEARKQLSVVVPVYFDPSVSKETILRILEEAFCDTELFCRRNRLLAVVDRETTADELLSNPPDNSVLLGIPIHRLERNRAKAGAIREGLQILLNTTDSEYFVTRDCDGDHFLEDIPRMVALAELVRDRTGQDMVMVMGARASLEKPMGWLRQEWELFTNEILVDLVSCALARSNRVIDRRFWNGHPPDLQSGYRVYSRAAAERTVECLSSLPDQREVLTLACEALPFAELLLDGGLVAQVQRLTLVEQPVSSYDRVDFAEIYGHLIVYLARRYEIPGQLLLSIVDNAIANRSMYFTDFREQLLRCRHRISPGAPPPLVPSFV